MKNVIRMRLILVCLLLFTLPTIAQQLPKRPMVTYRNPVIAGDFADPSVIRVGDTYYAAGTSSEWGPAYPVYTSKNLVEWEYVGPVFEKLPAWTMGSYWAPELFFRNGTFYVYYTARRRSDQKSFIGVASTTDLRKGFKDHGVLLEWTNEAIDAYVIEDNGKLYLTWKAYGLDKGKGIEILGAELSADGLKVTGKAFPMIKADAGNWEDGGAEGQAIFKRGKYWYMLYSGNACCGVNCSYQVGLARSEKIQGPWTKYTGNPVLFGDDTWKCPGHGTVVVTPDKRYFYLHHAYNAADFNFLGRQGVLSELVWDAASQWPSFRYGKATPAQAEAPVAATSVFNSDLYANYDRDTSRLPWVFDTRFKKPAYAIERNALRISNDNPALTGNFLGLVAKKGSYTFSAEVTASSDLAQHIIIYGDADNAIGLGVKGHTIELWSLREGKKEILKTQQIPDRYQDVELQLKTRFGQFFEFSWNVARQKIDSLATPIHLEAPWLPRWDRAPRIGVNVSGNVSGTGQIRSIRLKYD